MQHHELIYVKLSDLLERFKSEHPNANPTVPERLARWQMPLTNPIKGTGTATYIKVSSFLHYLDALGSQPVLDSKAPQAFAQYIHETTHTDNLCVMLDLPDPDWKL